MITFTAEILKVEVKKTLSMDREYKVIMVTDDSQILELAKYINEQSITITIEPNK